MVQERPTWWRNGEGGSPLSLFVFWENDHRTCLSHSLAVCLSRGEAEIVPTNGTNIQEVESGQFTLQLWEVGGEEKVRPYWDRYATGINGLVFVIDMADRDRLTEAVQALAAVFQKIGLASLPTLVLLNRSEQEDIAEVEAMVTAIPGVDVHC